MKAILTAEPEERETDFNVWIDRVFNEVLKSKGLEQK